MLYHYELHQARAADLQRQAEYERLARAVDAARRAHGTRGRHARWTDWLDRWSARRSAGRPVGETPQPAVSPGPAQPDSAVAGPSASGSETRTPVASIPSQRRATSSRT